MNRFLPTLRIHTWGGFGSQLYSIALYEELACKYPFRKLQVVFHSSGITYRAPEILKLFPHLNFLVVDDFEAHDGVMKIQPKSETLIKKALKILFGRLGLVSTCDDDYSTAKLKPWVISVRGHYSYRSINPEFLANLKESIDSISKMNKLEGENTCCVHYRLGDLPALKADSLVSEVALLSEIESAKKTFGFSRLIVFSDSPQEADERLTHHSELKIEAPNYEISLVILHSINARYFIGTSSKISFWIVGIRSIILHTQSSLPEKNKNEILGMVKGDSQLIKYYKSHS